MCTLASGPCHHGSAWSLTVSVLLRFLEDIEAFDPGHFTSLSFREAWEMDPQQRLLLEAAKELQAEQCLKDGPQNSAAFVGTMIYNPFFFSPPCDSARSLLSHSPSILANRISYTFDLKGPSVTFDAACASSLVAVHYGLRHISDFERAGALAMGSSVICDRRTFLAAKGLQLLSSDNRCKTFDVSADGIARGQSSMWTSHQVWLVF